MALNSASTLLEVKASYSDNASYHEDGSAAKARTFITACRLLLLMLPKRVSAGGRSQGEEVEFDARLLQDQIVEAKRFLTEFNVADAPRRGFSIEFFRD
jgi:hypothetical protein